MSDALETVETEASVWSSRRCYAYNANVRLLEDVSGTIFRDALNTVCQHLISYIHSDSSPAVDSSAFGSGFGVGAADRIAFGDDATGSDTLPVASVVAGMDPVDHALFLSHILNSLSIATADGKGERCPLMAVLEPDNCRSVNGFLSALCEAVMGGHGHTSYHAPTVTPTTVTPATATAAAISSSSESEDLFEEQGEPGHGERVLILVYTSRIKKQEDEH